MPRRVLLLLTVLAIGCHRPSATPLRIAVYRGEEFLPLTKALGHFQLEGIDAEVSELASSSKAMEALLGRSADVVAGGYDHSIRLAVEGRRTKSFMVLTVRSNLALVASPKSPRIHSIKDLKGAHVGVSAFGSSGNMFVNLLLMRNGLRREDIQLLATGGGHAVTVAWAEQGRVDAIVVQPPSLSILRARHPDLVLLANGITAEGTRSIFGVDAYPAICLMAHSEWLATHPDIALRVTRAVRRTLDWLGTHTAEEFQMQLRGHAAEAAELDGLRAAIANRSTNGRMPRGGPESIRDAVAASEPAVSRVDLAATYTDEFLPR